MLGTIVAPPPFSPNNTQAVVDALGHLGDSSLFLPATPGYATAKAIFNLYSPNAPDFVYECTNVAEVSAAVRTAHQFGLRVAIKSGGRSMEGFSTCR